MFGLQNIGITEVLIVAVILLIIFGPKKLPEFIKGIGEAVREVIKAFRGDDKKSSKKE